MNRFMVWMGFGSLVVPILSAPITAPAEMPRYINSTSAPVNPGIRWHETLESGWEESRRRNVPMVIYITAERCRYCAAMKQNTWCDESVQQRISRGFVAIRLMPRRNSATLGRINVKTYPTTMVGVPQGKILHHRTGYQPPAALHGLLSESAERWRSRR